MEKEGPEETSDGIALMATDGADNELFNGLFNRD